MNPNSAGGRFYRGFSGAASDMLFDPISMATSAMDFAISPTKTVDQVWHGVSRLWSTRNPDGSLVTPEERGEGLAAFAAIALPALAKLPHAADIATRRIAIIRRMHEIGFTDYRVQEFVRWSESHEGVGYLEAFERGRRKGPDGKPMNGPDPISGVQIKNGYPVFRTKKVVRIEPNFHDRLDFKASNAKAGFSETPTGYTWHHSQKYGRMELVETEVHKKTRHTGGRSLWKNRSRRGMGSSGTNGR